MKSALRLRRPADFARAKRLGAVQRDRALMVSVCANRLQRNRYGVVVGKHIGIAVVRNRVKRRLRAVLAEMHPQLRQGFDIVVIARRPRGCATLSRAQAYYLRIMSARAIDRDMLTC